MTHDELLKVIIHGQTMNYEWRIALRAVVELHKPIDLDDGEPKCLACETTDWYKIYPCPTIQAIEKELG